MHTNERFDIILEYIKLHKRATIAELSKILYVSSATVRRDLSEMQKLGLVKRTHGGAMCVDTSEEVSIYIRKEMNAREKEETASIAMNHLPEFQTIFIDNSSTSLALAERLNLQHKLVVTNGFRVAGKLLERENVRIIMPGGELHENTDFSGSMTCNALREFHFDLMLSSCASIGMGGTYENSLSGKELKATALEVSDCHILLADNSKFHLQAPYRTASLREFDYIFTNANDQTVAPYREAGFKIINA